MNFEHVLQKLQMVNQELVDMGLVNNSSPPTKIIRYNQLHQMRGQLMARLKGMGTNVEVNLYTCEHEDGLNRIVALANINEVNSLLRLKYSGEPLISINQPVRLELGKFYLEKEFISLFSKG